MTETAYEVRISVWNLDVEKDHKMTDVFEFSDKDKAYTCAELWTNLYDVCIRDGKKFHYKIEVMHIEYNTYKYSEGGR